MLLLLFSSDEWSDSIRNLAESYLEGGVTSMIGILLHVIPMSIMISKVFFIFHIVVRGLWIGTLGLRSVSGEIDLSNLRLNSWMRRSIQKYNGNFDTYIFKLENLSSVLFGFNFLLIFYMFSALLSIGWITLFTILGSTVHSGFGVIAVILNISLFLNVVDFMVMQRLKKGKWGYVFYPFYLITNSINLSFLYRSLHYNFVDHKYTRRFLRGIVWFVIGFFIIAGFEFNLSPWLRQVSPNSELAFTRDNYKSELDEKHIANISLSQFENTNLLQLTTPFRQSKAFQQYLYRFCPELEDMETFRWYHVKTNKGLYLSNKSPKSQEVDLNSVMDCYLEQRQFKINSELVMPDKSLFLFTDDLSKPSGIMHFFPIDSLDAGMHDLEIISYTLKEEEVDKESKHIAFYKSRGNN